MGKIIIRGILAGVAVLVVMMSVGMACGAILPGMQASYENYALFRPMENWRANFFWLYPIFIGIGLSWMWSKVKLTMDAGKSSLTRAFSFSMLYLVVSIIPGMIVTYASFQVSKYHIIMWTLSSFIGAIAGSLVIALMDRDKNVNAG